VIKMPIAKIGDKTNLDRREFLELKSKGEKLKIRLASSDYYYEGKHFFQKENKDWEVTSCPRVNNELDCKYCEEYFAIKKQMKEETDKAKLDALDKKARMVKANIAFYYPALDRETGLAGIFKTTLMIRLAFEEQVKDGVDILNFDFIVKRTEKPGSYYSLDRVDSADTSKLTKEEKAELEKAQKMNIGEIIGGKKGSMSFTPEEPMSDTVKTAKKVFDDIPF